MKKKFLMFFALMLLLVPIYTFAESKDGYDTMNLIEALQDDEIQNINTEYKETNDQITIYLFRGKGCSYCHAFLEYLNSISSTHGKYFKLESYEVWNSKKNADLMKEVAEFLDQDAGGVPFIIIGDKIFPGYAEGMNGEIEKAIMNLYESEEKYDVLEELEKEKKAERRKEFLKTYGIPAACSLVFSVLTAIVVLSIVNKKNEVLYEKVEVLEEQLKNSKKEMKEHKDVKEHKEHKKK